MAETCIVCLGDLGDSTIPYPSKSPVDSDEKHIGTCSDAQPSNSVSLPVPEQELIAHLLPCGHNLHDECLKPWVERANSCPICRQNFNTVELCHTIGGSWITRLSWACTNAIVGSIISSYAVSDRTQVADIDPSMIIEELDEPESQPCPICNSDEHEDVLLLCDGCDAAYHTYCVDLDSVPVGAWFCDDCATTRAIESVAQQDVRTLPRRSHHPYDARTRGQQRQLRIRSQASSSSWARVWQTVWERLNIDLDFPFDEDASAARYQRLRRHNDRQRQGHRAWERRLQVARQQGGANRFEETAEAFFVDRPTLSRPRPEAPEPESREELLAWNALEKARDIQAGPAPKSRKRKSTTSSPSDADGMPRRKKRRSATSSPQEPRPWQRRKSGSSSPQESRPIAMERKLKRPQTRRAPHIGDGASDTPDPSKAKRNTIKELVNGHASDSSNGAGNPPGFLQSLLNEVESSTAEDNHVQSRPKPVLSNIGISDHPSPYQSSPAASPTVSNHPSPRAMSATPPPLHSGGPGSPVPLTSKVEPIYPPAPEFNREQSPQSDTTLRRSHRTSKSQTRIPGWAMQTATATHQQSSSPRPRSEETSPNRANMSLGAKESIQKLVKGALRSPYQKGQVSKDQYTEINRNVSRMLYDMVGKEENFSEDTDDTWGRLARKEVEKAVYSLRGAVEV